MAKRSTTLAINSLLDSLGVKGGELPQIEISTYQPVMVMADLGKTLSSEPVEARGQGGYYLTAPAGGRANAFQLQCVSPGGLVIERMFVSLPAYQANDGFVVCNLTPVPTPWLSGPIDYMQCGGRLARSRLDVDALLTSIPAHCYIPLDRTARSRYLPDLRWYVRPGGFFACQSGIQGTAFAFDILWRELPDVIGGGA